MGHTLSEYTKHLNSLPVYLFFLKNFYFIYFINPRGEIAEGMSHAKPSNKQLYKIKHVLLRVLRLFKGLKIDDTNNDTNEWIFIFMMYQKLLK